MVMKPQSCRNCGKEIFQNQRVCPKCGRDTEQDVPDRIEKTQDNFFGSFFLCCCGFNVHSCDKLTWRIN